MVWLLSQVVLSPRLYCITYLAHWRRYYHPFFVRLDLHLIKCIINNSIANQSIPSTNSTQFILTANRLSSQWEIPITFLLVLCFVISSVISIPELINLKLFQQHSIDHLNWNNFILYIRSFNRHHHPQHHHKIEIYFHFVRPISASLYISHTISAS